MCGRFSQTRSWPELAALYRITEPVTAREPERRYNIAPTHDVAVVRATASGEGRELTSLRWGLVPPWAKDLRIGARMINARAETVATKPAFRAAFRARRCLIVASGFYEWQTRAGRSKQPFHVCADDGGPLAFAGLWERWKGPGTESIETCAIITTEATADLCPLHHRMPAILAPSQQDRWLNGTATGDDLRALLRPYAGTLRAQAVSRRVNDIRQDEAGCVDPLAATPMQRSVDLFAESSPPLCHTR